jgi:hypothetical protein
VAIHVKGAAGSTRSIDDNPALTLSFDKFNRGQKISGIDKLHLNNSVQDSSLLNESVASFLYHRAGIPTARSTHALVTLNGRDLGIYVLKEGYNRSFLRRNFPSPDGNLYDGGFLRDIDQDLVRDAGEGEDTHEDLRQLQQAAQTGDRRIRREALEKWLDVDRFITMAAIQHLTCDWDGYVDNRNNYRLYHDPITGQFNFIPHGMDQLFGDVGRELGPGGGGIVAGGVFSVPEWVERYWNRMEEIAGPGIDEAIAAHLAEVRHRLEPVLAARSRGDAGWRRGEIDGQCRRIGERLRIVHDQLARRPKPVTFGTNQFLNLANWQPKPGVGQSQMDTMTFGGDRTLRIAAKQRGTVGSWRTALRLPPGKYSFAARVKTLGVDPFDAQPRATGEQMVGGAGIRISGSLPASRLKGNAAWQLMTQDFELTDLRDVEFVAELRANAGQAWFDLDSMKLTLVKKRDE